MDSGLSSKTPPRASARLALTRFGPVETLGPPIYVFADVLEELLYHAAWRPQASAALLSGGLYQGPEGPFVELTGFDESAWVERTLDLHSLFARSHRALRERLDPGLRVLGWSHHLPGQGAQPTPSCLVIHRTFFNLPEQLLLLTDVPAQRVALYRLDPDGHMHNVGFWLAAAPGQALRFPAAPAPRPSTPKSSRISLPIVGAIPAVPPPDEPAPSATLSELLVVEDAELNLPTPSPDEPPPILSHTLRAFPALARTKPAPETPPALALPLPSEGAPEDLRALEDNEDNEDNEAPFPIIPGAALEDTDDALAAPLVEAEIPNLTSTQSLPTIARQAAQERAQEQKSAHDSLLQLKARLNLRRNLGDAPSSGTDLFAGVRPTPLSPHEPPSTEAASPTTPAPEEPGHDAASPPRAQDGD